MLKEALNAPEGFLTVLEVAGMLRVSRTSVYRLAERRKIPFYKLERGLIFSRSDVETFLSNRRVETMTDHEREEIQAELVG